MYNSDWHFESFDACYSRTIEAAYIPCESGLYNPVAVGLQVRNVPFKEFIFKFFTYFINTYFNN